VDSSYGPGVYRVYKSTTNGDCSLEINAFRTHDNPYEDLAEGYFILNTNIRNDPADHADMLTNRKAAAYFSPWKEKIARLGKGDLVFLYQSGVGVVVFGETDGQLRKACYHSNPEHPKEEYYRKQNDFRTVDPLLTAADIKKITGTNYVFMSTLFGLDEDSGKKIRRYIDDRNAVTTSK
jgi:hypothetical protein